MVLIIAKVLEAADFPEFVNAGLCAVVSATMYVPFVNTPILDPIKQAFGDEEAVAKLSRQIPMNKIGDTDDVSYAIMYLASDESKFMTGTEIVLDGGLSAM